MTFRQFAFKNVLRNKRLYIAYFLSSLFTVMVFFTFAIFAFHPAFSDGTVNENALFGMFVSGGIIYVFSFFFVLYSMSSFLQSRKREFGLLMMLGASNKQIRWMVFLENILIGFFATIGGILAGLVFAKTILLIAENVLMIEESLDFYFPTLAIGITFISFSVLFFCISVFVSVVLRTNKLIDLIKSHQKSKGEPKASVFLSLLAALLIIFGYAVAMLADGMEVVAVMIPVIIVVIIGTYFLFTQLSVFIIRRLKRNKHIFWRKTNMLLFSDLAFRMKDNARTFFMVAIISTVAFSAIGTLFGFQSYLTKGLKEANPYTFSYVPWGDVTEAEAIENVKMIHETLTKENLDSRSEQAWLTYYEIAGFDKPVLIMSATDYNRFAALINEEELYPNDDEIFAIEQSEALMTFDSENDKLMSSSIRLDHGEALKPSKLLKSEVILELNGFYVVHDHVYERLGTPDSRLLMAVWIVNDVEEAKLIEVGRKLHGELSHHITAIDYMLYEINKAYGPILFIGLFIGMVFFVSAGSFLYFRLFTDLEEEKQKFRSIVKIGLTRSELKKVVNRQVALLFFSPIIVALVHGAVALYALSNLFNYNLTFESSIVLGSFAVIQVIYFIIVRLIYIKQIERAVF